MTRDDRREAGPFGVTPAMEDELGRAPARLGQGTRPLPSGDREDTGQFRRLVESSVDELDSRVELSDRERVLAREVAGLVARGVGEIIRDRPANQRLAQLETEMLELRNWRLKLTGVADTNGRIGTIERSIVEHRADTERALELIRIDVGPPDERKAEREAAKMITSIKDGIKSRMRISLLVSVAAAGASAWGWVGGRSDARAAAAATAARIDTRLDSLERLVFPRAFAAPTPDPVRTP